MLEVSVTTFRNHISVYLERVRKGEELALTSHGKVIARLVPPEDERDKALQRLAALRATSRISDVVSPLDAEWEADRVDP